MSILYDDLPILRVKLTAEIFREASLNTHGAVPGEDMNALSTENLSANRKWNTITSSVAFWGDSFVPKYNFFLMCGKTVHDLLMAQK